MYALATSPLPTSNLAKMRYVVDLLSQIDMIQAKFLHMLQIGFLCLPRQGTGTKCMSAEETVRKDPRSSGVNSSLPQRRAWPGMDAALA